MKPKNYIVLYNCIMLKSNHTSEIDIVSSLNVLRH